MSIKAGLDTHEAGVDDLDAVAVAQPHLAVHLHHAPDGVVRLTQVQQVVVPAKYKIILQLLCSKYKLRK